MHAHTRACAHTQRASAHLGKTSISTRSQCSLLSLSKAPLHSGSLSCPWLLRKTAHRLLPCFLRSAGPRSGSSRPRWQAFPLLLSFTVNCPVPAPHAPWREDPKEAELTALGQDQDQRSSGSKHLGRASNAWPALSQSHFPAGTPGHWGPGGQPLPFSLSPSPSRLVPVFLH